MSDEINRIFAEASAAVDEITGYECRNCGEVFNIGRNGRQHMFNEHDNPLGLKKLTEGGNE
jgi:hypothetical protein